MNKVEGRYKRGGYYNVVFRNDTASIRSMGCKISCGIDEIENVGLFITKLQQQSASTEEIVHELRKVRSTIKRGRMAHVMASIVDTPSNRPVIELLEKQREVKVMRPKHNPNSGNKINVIIM